MAWKEEAINSNSPLLWLGAIGLLYMLASSGVLPEWVIFGGFVILLGMLLKNYDSIIAQVKGLKHT